MKIIIEKGIFKRKYLVPIVASIIWLLSCARPTITTEELSGVTYRNPRVYNARYSFEIVPDLKKIDRKTDLKVWIPIPREWASQRTVKIVNVTPEPNERYQEPEHGNQMLYWDLAKEPEQEKYKISIEFRVESFEIHADIDQEAVGTYDETTDEYQLYTRSSSTIQITPKIRQLALEAVGNETNLYLKAKKIFDFVRSRMRPRSLDTERGRGTEVLINNPIIDSDSGLEYFEGSVFQQTIFFIALCRSVGIPSRTVQGTIGWDPTIKEEDLEPLYEAEQTSTGLGEAVHYGIGRFILRPTTWVEFFLPGYGWIPADLGHDFGHLDNFRIIFSKGVDILVGPDASEVFDENYGTQWVLLNDGRVDLFREPVWNISKIHRLIIKGTHFSDPFPADAYAHYAYYRVYSQEEEEFFTVTARESKLLLIYNASRRNEDVKFGHQYSYLIHMFKQIVGEDNLEKIFRRYHNRRLSTKEPVQTDEFRDIAEEIYGKPLDWYFDHWVESDQVPRFKLSEVEIAESGKGWEVSGKLAQVGETILPIRIELGFESESGLRIHNLWTDSRDTYFKFKLSDKPTELIVDPYYHVPCIRKTSPRLYMLWHYYSNLAIIYGTIKEAGVNRAAAVRINDEEFGFEPESIKADTTATEEDLKKDVVLLFGRPETNEITRKLAHAFPIQFEEGHFLWEGISYDKPAQGVMQIVESPVSPSGWVISYAGVGSEATSKISDVKKTKRALSEGLYHWGPRQASVYDSNASYVIFDGDSVLASGNWELDGDYIWNFEESDY